MVSYRKNELLPLKSPPVDEKRRPISRVDMLTITLMLQQPLELLCKVYLRQFSVVNVRGSRQADLSRLN